MIKLKRIKAGEYTTLDGKFLIRKNFMLNLWFAADIKTFESVVDCEKTLRKIRESLERYLMTSEARDEYKDDPESSTDVEAIPVPVESAEETAKKTEIDVIEESVTMEKNIKLTNFCNAIIKALGMSRAKELRYMVQGVNVFFEYKGVMYKYYTPQSKLYKLSGQRFNLISLRGLKKESDETDDISDSMYTARPPP